MDASVERIAYRCLPLAMANHHGWELRAPCGVSAIWNGGPRPGDVEVRLDEDIPHAATHFGHGMLTFIVGAIFRTPPGLNLWVMPPPNRAKDGIQGLSGLIETDWIPHSFTMNWQFTRPDTEVRFEKGEPFCQFFPVPRGLTEAMTSEIRDISEDPDLQRQHALAKLRRNAIRIREETTGETDAKLLHQGWYTKGVTPDEQTRFEPHQTAMAVRPFRRQE